MNTVIVDTPNTNLREEAKIVSIQISPDTIYASVQVTSTDLATARVLGVRTPVPPPDPVTGLPPASGIRISDLPAAVQTKVNDLADYLLALPYIFS
jgi:hypothetical protein